MTAFCDNWSCPAMASCAVHSGRALSYASMEPFSTFRGIPDDEAGYCEEYRRDEPRRWLLEQSMQQALLAAVTAVTALPIIRPSKGKHRHDFGPRRR